MLSCAFCLWKSALLGRTSRISDRDGTAGKKKKKNLNQTSFRNVPRELPFPQRKLINVKERPAKIKRKQQSLGEHITPLSHIEFIIFKIVFS